MAATVIFTKSTEIVLMLGMYAKSEKEDLTHAEKEAIRKSVEGFKRSQET